MAIYTLAGRWGLNRFLEAPEYLSPFLELRTWTVALLLSITLISYLRPGLNSNFNTPTFVLPCIFTILLLTYMFVTSCWAPNSNFLVSKIFEVFLIFTVTLSVYKLVQVGKLQVLISSFWTCILISSAIMAMLAVLMIIGGASGRLSVLAGGPNIFGRIMGFLILASLYFWSKNSANWIFIPLIGVATLLIVLSGSRGALLASGFSLIVFLILSKVKIRRFVVLGVSVALVISSMLLTSTFYASVTDSFQERIFSLLIEEVYTAGREDIYVDALRIGIENPVWGVGLAGFQAQIGTYPHNIFLEIFAECGSLGVLFLLFFLTTTLKSIIQNRHNLNPSTVSAFGLIFVACQFSGDLFDSRALFLFSLLALVPHGHPQPMKKEVLLHTPVTLRRQRLTLLQS